MVARRSAGAALVALATIVPAASPVPAAAEDLEVEVSLEPQTVAAGEPVLLVIEARGHGVRGLDLQAAFDLDNLEIAAGPHRSRSFHAVNLTVSRRESLTWQLLPVEPGVARVRSITLTVRGEELEVAEREIRVTGEPPSTGLPPSPFRDPFDRSPRRGSPRSAPRVFLRAETAPARPYVGQQVTYTLYVYTQADIDAIHPESLPAFRGFWVRDIPPAQRDRVETVEVDGERIGRVVLLRRALFPLGAGEVVIESARARLLVKTASRGVFGSLFPRAEELLAGSNPVTLEVRPLPPPPPDFHGAVGDLSLGATLSPERVSLGDAAVLTLTLAGAGHLRGLPDPPLPPLPGLRTFQPHEEGKEELIEERVIAERSWSFPLVPERVGHWQLPALELPFFDPAAGTYRMAVSPALELTVDPPASRTAVVAPSDGARPVPGADDSAAAAVDGRLAMLAVLVPSGIGLLLFLARRRRLQASPLHASRRRLAERLRDAERLDRPRDLAAAIEQAWQEFLAEGWRLAPDTPSSQWGLHLEARGVEPGPAADLVGLADDLHYLRYAPELASVASVRRDVLKRSRRILRTLRPSS